PPNSKARQVGKPQPARVYMETAELGAAVQLRKHLARIEQAVGIEGAFQALLMREVALVEHRTHQVALFDPDPVLAGQDATHFDRKLEDIRAKSLGPLDLVGLVGIVKNERVKVAVAGVKDVRQAEAVVIGQRAHPGQDLGYTRPWDRAVHAIVIGRDPPDRRERSLAAGPEGEPLRLSAAEPDF